MSTKKIIILGAGIHGCAISYYLTEMNIKPLIIERTSVACAASGKAGGFLAREWGSGATTPLHQISFGTNCNSLLLNDLLKKLQ